MYRYNIVLLGHPPVCSISGSSLRRNIPAHIPAHEPYLPTIREAMFYNCTVYECNPAMVNSITQIAIRKTKFKMCFIQAKDEHECMPLHYWHYKDVDKLLFLANNVPGKSFYFIDCLAYSDGGRVCHKKNGSSVHSKLVDTGNLARPNETNVLLQEEFLCEEDVNMTFNCDLNRYVPYSDGLQEKEYIEADKQILLKIDKYIVILKYNCIGSWCGYSGKVDSKLRSRRHDSFHKVYRCYYSNRQQICKRIQVLGNIIDDRDWLTR